VLREDQCDPLKSACEVTQMAWYHALVHIPWGDLELFLAISESGSLSAAAKILKVTQPTVSRRLADLEGVLAEPLFTRSVEGVALTAFGERMIVSARRMAESAGDAERAASGREVTPKGTVRVTAPPGVAYQLLAPLAAHLRDVLPDVTLEVVATVKYVDLVRREADLALRSEPLDRPSRQRDLVCVASHEHRVTAFATRAYIAKLPRPCRMSDVGWVGWAPPLDHLPPNPQLAARIPGFRPVFASDDYIVQLRAAEAGVGAVVFADFRSQFALPTSLVPVPLSFGKLTSSLHLVAARGSLAVPRIKAVADLLARELTPKASSRPPLEAPGERRRSTRGTWSDSVRTARVSGAPRSTPDGRVRR
jgi:DNA-binding transcriptional LysR family regulator